MRTPTTVVGVARTLPHRLIARRSFGIVAKEVRTDEPQQTTTLNDLLSKTKPVVTVKTNANVADAVKVMTKKKAPSLFVEDDRGFLVGILKESNIIANVDKAGFELDTTKVTDIMEKNFSCGKANSTVRESLELLHKFKQDHLPILTCTADPNEPAKASLIRAIDATSLISSKQIIGQYYYELIGSHPSQLRPEEREQLEAQLSKMPTVKNLMKTREAANKGKGEIGTMVLNTLAEDRISVAECIGQMNKFGLGSVAIMEVVRDVPMLKGICTEQDIIRRALGAGLDIRTTPVVDIMTSHGLTTITTKETLMGCAFKMIDANVRHLPVVSPKGSHILAIVSSKDVVAYFCSSMETGGK